MKFILVREKLLKPLQLVCGVVERRQTLPILANVLFDIRDAALHMTSTDLEVEMTAQMPLDISEKVKTTLPARKLMDICRALPDGADIEFDLAGDKAIIRSAKSRFTLTTLAADEFPNIGEIEPSNDFPVPQKTIRHLIERTHFAMAQQDVRYYLNGLMWETLEDKLRIVATDGHRLALCDVTSEGLQFEEHQQVIIPRKGVMELFRLVEDTEDPVNVQIASNHIRFSTSGWTFTSKLVDGRFPDYLPVIPTQTENVLCCDRELFRQALVRTSILSNEKFKSVSLGIKDEVLRIVARNPEQEEAEEELPVDYKGKALEIGFNATYLLDVLNALSTTQIQMSLRDPNSSCLIQGVGDPDSQYVIMPMRL